MMEAKVRPIAGGTRLNKILILAAILIFLSVIGFSVYQSVIQAHSLPRGTSIISQAALEEKYGLRVSLIGVTAAGGLVDVRLKILDGVKARALLGDPKNFPSLFVEQRYFLHASEDYRAQEIRFDDGGNLFVMFSNPRNLVKPGTPIMILFGNMALEPIPAK